MKRSASSRREAHDDGGDPADAASVGIGETGPHVETELPLTRGGTPPPFLPGEPEAVLDNPRHLAMLTP